MAEILKVEEVLNNLELKPDMLAAEFGCGSAEFALTLAKKLHKGKVYALDIQEERLSALKGRAVVQKVNNIVIVHCDLEAERGSTLPENSLDVIVIPSVLFQAENKSAIIGEGKRVLKIGGQLLIIDWLKVGPFSPKTGMIKPDDVKKMADELGLIFKNEFAVGDYHYALLFTK